MQDFKTVHLNRMNCPIKSQIYIYLRILKRIINYKEDNDEYYCLVL